MSPSDRAKKVCGVYLPEHDGRVLPPLLAWLQRECRSGVLKPMVQEFINGRQDLLDSVLFLDSIQDGLIKGHLAKLVRDHESTSPFKTETRFILDPAAKTCVVDELT